MLNRRNNIEVFSGDGYELGFNRHDLHMTGSKAVRIAYVVKKIVTNGSIGSAVIYILVVEGT